MGQTLQLQPEDAVAGIRCVRQIGDGKTSPMIVYASVDIHDHIPEAMNEIASHGVWQLYKSYPNDTTTGNDCGAETAPDDRREDSSARTERAEAVSQGTGEAENLVGVEAPDETGR